MKFKGPFMPYFFDTPITYPLYSFAARSSQVALKQKGVEK
jgi:hypothetical protein